MPIPRRLVANSAKIETPKVVEIHKKVQFVSSGSRMLDLVLGGGWPAGRFVNIVGDRSSGKTLLAVEAVINFAKISTVDQVRYAESEAAFDVEYQRSLGLPVGIDPVTNIETVEDFYSDLEKFLAKVDPKYPSLYVLDSLDALSDAAEMDREIDKGSFGAGKARKLSEMFRRIVKRVEQANCTLFIISQIRDKLNVSFGETKTRSGGRALDFYCSQIVWLAEKEKIRKSVYGAERVTGLWVRALTKKNKLAKPFREADLAILFGYGVHDGLSMIDWLIDNKNMEEDWKAQNQKLLGIMKKPDRQALLDMETTLLTAVTKHWNMIENALETPLRKY